MNCSTTNRHHFIWLSLLWLLMAQYQLQIWANSATTSALSTSVWDYLNPNTGRFWSMDSFAGNSSEPLSLHKYLYCEGNPISGSDPSGHEDLVSISFTIGLMSQQASLEMKGAQAALTSARTMFGADENVNNIIYGSDVANIISDKVGQVTLGAGAAFGGFKLLNLFKNALTGSAATQVAERFLLSLQTMSAAGLKAVGGEGDCGPMAAGVAEALSGRTIPVPPPDFFKQSWIEPSILEVYFKNSFKGLFRTETDARAGIIQVLQQSGGEGSHGLVIGDKLGSQTSHVFNVVLRGGDLEVIDVSAAGTGFQGLTSFQFMPVK